MGTPSPDDRLTFRQAQAPDASIVLELRVATARDLTRRFGRGHWSTEGTERGVLNDLRISQVWLALRGDAPVATFRLSTRKPWAIDPSYFTPSARPLYLTDMAVRPEVQRQGVGHQCVAEMISIARQWPSDTIRLDAYDADAGAGGFYARCGFREVGRVTYHGTPLVYFEMMLADSATDVAYAR
jgi:GNAT superfamily N-acetyltransferase